MGRIFFAALLLAFAALPALAQPVVLVEVDVGRTGADGSAVKQRAILTMPATPTDTALLVFRGNPGYMLAKSVADKQRNLGWFKGAEPVWLAAGIALVQMDCPTDQWGETPRPPATHCLTRYRGSQQHADDVRKMMAELKAKHGLTRHFILGHSIGTVSSRWLSITLQKDDVAGIIHSATINQDNPKGLLLDTIGRLPVDFPRKAAGMPMLHVHNEMDACPVTQYGPVRSYARDNLVTVRGGIAEGDPCGVGHLHSHQGREEVAARAIATWIKAGRVEAFVGE